MGIKKILVTGATGATGREVTRILQQKDQTVRVLVHEKDDRSEALAKRGLEVVVGDLLDLNVAASALTGVDTAYFCYPIQPGVIQSTAYFAQAAREAGVTAIVNMSQINAHRHAVSVASHDHWIAQGIFDRSGVPVTHIRPTFFAEWYLYLAHRIKEGVLRLPLAKDGRHAPIAAEDMGRVIANILSKPEEHAGKSYELVGPVAYDQLEIASIISKSIGRKVTYEQVPVATYLTDIVEGGIYSKTAPAPEKAQALGDYLMQHLNGAAAEHQQGLLAATNDIVERIGGVKPLSLEQFIVKHQAVFQNTIALQY